MPAITEDTLNSLAKKLESLNLTEDELAVYDRLIGRSGMDDAETMGFALPSIDGVWSEDELVGVASEDELISIRVDAKSPRLSAAGLKLGISAGLFA